MSEQSAKPYLIRAICEWCADNGLTPYLAVKVNAETRVPMSYVKNGEIVLNIGASATRKLTVDNVGVRFSARFSGTSHEVAVPMSAVAGIFAKETGYGFAFTVSANPAASLADATLPKPETDTPDAQPGEVKEPKEAENRRKGKAKASHLQVVK
ncbi:MAG TPA: ClpXP protease specificity-enhancing factor [Casimicrobiaceae bacterium]|nr:ClpXP protease specificity-enhancing factor [Casimicrobiaceae bacterium]